MVKKKGGNAADLISGSNVGDTLYGLGGGDTIKSLAGNDAIAGGDGRDTLFGNDGDDLLYGYGSSDRIQSESLIHTKTIANIGSGASAITNAPGDSFLYGVSKDNGAIYRIDPDSGEKTKFLDIPNGEIGSGGERGVLGLTFDPDYARNGRFFVYMTNADGNNEVREYHRGAGNPPKADPEPVKTLLTIEHPNRANHNGGSMAFGPDGYLYIGTGDGGGGGDPDGNAQNKNELLGKILRIDVDGDDFPADDSRNYAIPEDNAFVGKAGADEIWAIGMRNPWRFFFDKNGDFYIGDVGQNAWEEVDYVKAGTKSGLNFGWDYREGPDGYEGTPPNPKALTDPVVSYSHEGRSASITGGEVYHGDGGMQGTYFFSDFVTGRLYTTRIVDGKATDTTVRNSQVDGPQLTQITSYGHDSNDNLYAVSYDGRIIRLTPGEGAGDGADQLYGGAGNDRIFGGAGNDKLFGGSGNDTLDGGVGNDTLSGASGRDVFVFKTGTGSDTIVDFDATGSDHDVIDISGLTGIVNYTDLMTNHVTQSGDNVVITSGDDRIVLEGISKADLTRQDFDFG